MPAGFPPLRPSVSLNWASQSGSTTAAPSCDCKGAVVWNNQNHLAVTVLGRQRFIRNFLNHQRRSGFGHGVLELRLASLGDVEPPGLRPECQKAVTLAVLRAGSGI